MGLISMSMFLPLPPLSFFFFFNDTATTEIYTLSLHDALPIFFRALAQGQFQRFGAAPPGGTVSGEAALTFPYGLISPAQLFAMRVMRFMHDHGVRSEEHTSELQSHLNLVCRLLLEKKKYWNDSGADVKFGLFSGLEINVESLRSLVAGWGVFATPIDPKAGQARNGPSFSLYSPPTM